MKEDRLYFVLRRLIELLKQHDPLEPLYSTDILAMVSLIDSQLELKDEQDDKNEEKLHRNIIDQIGS